MYSVRKLRRSRSNLCQIVYKHINTICYNNGYNRIERDPVCIICRYDIMGIGFHEQWLYIMRLKSHYLKILRSGFNDKFVRVISLLKDCY